MARLLDYFRTEIWNRDLRQESWPKRMFFGAVRAAVHMAAMFREHFLSVRAGALTVTTMLAIVPVAATGLSVAKAFGLRDDLDARLAETAAELPAQFRDFVAHLRSLVDEIDFAKLGVLSTLIVLYTGLSLFVNIEQSINHTWQVTNRRSWLRRVTDFIAVVFLVPGLIVGAATISGVLQSARNEGSWLSNYGILVTLYDYGLFVVPYVMLGVAFAALYKFMPNARVRWNGAAIGGLFAGCALHAMTGLYVKLQWGVAQNNAIYGTLAALPLLIVYLRLAWTIVLLGAELSHAVQNADLLGNGRQVRNPSPILRERIALALTQRTAVRFSDGDGSADLAETAVDLDVPRTVIDEVAGRLVDAGVLARVDDASVLPGRPPESISVDAVRTAMRGELAEAVESRLTLPDSLESALAGAERAQRETLGRARFSSAV